MSQHDDPLDPLLREFEARTPPLPAGVVRDVWRRIAEADAPQTPLASGWLARLQQAFARPAFAVSFVLGCVLCGLFAAEIRVSQEHATRSAELRTSYLHLIAPLLEPASAPAQPTRSTP